MIESSEIWLFLQVNLIIDELVNGSLFTCCILYCMILSILDAKHDFLLYYLPVCVLLGWF